MCDFLVVSSKKPFPISDYLEEVVRRRKWLRHDEHGWGFYFDDGKNQVLVKEPIPPWKSSLFMWLERREIKTKAKFLMLHVRKATQGEVSWFNTHPFHFEYNGKRYVFAHKGDISKKLDYIKDMVAKPLGNTDSERFFLAAIKVIEDNGGLPEALHALKYFSDEIGYGARLNYFLYDGEYLIVYDGQDCEPLYYGTKKNLFIAASEEFRTDTMGEVGLRRIFLVKDGSVIEKIEE